MRHSRSTWDPPKLARRSGIENHRFLSFRRVSLPYLDLVSFFIINDHFTLCRGLQSSPPRRYLMQNTEHMILTKTPKHSFTHAQKLSFYWFCRKRILWFSTTLGVSYCKKRRSAENVQIQLFLVRHTFRGLFRSWEF